MPREGFFPLTSSPLRHELMKANEESGASRTIGPNEFGRFMRLTGPRSLVRTRALLEFPAVVAAVALGLGAVYVGTSMGCAAAVSCYLRDGACFFVCANPVAELPRLLVLGVLIGVLPALGATILLLVQDVVEGGSRWRRVAPVLGALLLAIPGLALVFSIDGIVLGLLSLPIAAAFLIAMNVAILPEWRAAFLA